VLLRTTGPQLPVGFFFKLTFYLSDISGCQMAEKSLENGNAEGPVPSSSLPPVVGINFGNSYASIAVFTKVRALITFRKMLANS
jgi:hypothetical protein